MRKGIIIIAALIAVFLTVGAVGLVVFEFTGNSETGNPENFFFERETRFYLYKLERNKKGA